LMLITTDTDYTWEFRSGGGSGKRSLPMVRSFAIGKPALAAATEGLMTCHGVKP